MLQRGLEIQPPYSVALLDELQYQLSLAQEEVTARAGGLESSKADVKMQERLLEERQASRRRLLDRSQLKTTPGLEQDRLVENATWAVKAAESALELAQGQVDNDEQALALAEVRKKVLTRKVELVRSQFLFTKPILDEQLAALEAARERLLDAHQAVEKKVTQALADVKAAENEAGDDPAGQARLAVANEWLTTYQRQKLLLEQSLELNLTQRDLWERRYGLRQGKGLTSLSDWESATRGLLRRLESSRGTLEAQLAQLRGRMASVVESVPDEDPAVRALKNRQAQALAAHQKSVEAALADYQQTDVLAQRLQSEIGDNRKSLTWSDRLTRGWSSLVELWRIELYTVGDSSVTVGKMVAAFLVLLVGLTLAGRTTGLVSRKLLTQLPVNDSSRANLERGLRYFFILMVCLISLRVVNIPLTIFTFLGGTLAIAVGFGAQNILNNFISGLILMAERPVRVGDLIEVEQTTGVVEEIGARSTRVRLGSGVHVVLPNSHLLENKVINWTLTDQTVRSSVSVGVAYGSDPKQVMDLISRATLSIETIERSPEHLVVLESFGDSSIQYTVYFWVSIREPLNKRVSESNLRLAIAELFQEHGIAIPFPQRDLNINHPLPVRVVGPQESL